MPEAAREPHQGHTDRAACRECAAQVQSRRPQQSYTDQQVQQVNPGKHKVEHEEFVSEDVYAIEDRAAVLKDLHDHEGHTTGECPEKARQRSRPLVELAQRSHRSGDAPGTGEQKQRIQRAKSLVQRQAGRLEKLRGKATVVEKSGEQECEKAEFAQHHNPHAGFCLQRFGLTRGGAHTIVASASLLIARSKYTVSVIHQTRKITSAIQSANNPFQANGPLWKSTAAKPGAESNAAQRLR